MPRYPVINFSNKPVTVKIEAKHFAGSYTELFSEKKVELPGQEEFILKAWGYVELFSGK
jgi:cyclomaltodextrinase / maltogenic alpha-amylase / neopullulanase